MKINWLPSPYFNSRDSRYALRAVVNHRIVGSLASARGAFGATPGTSRNASSHFGIGYINGVLTIDQYVDLRNMAWTNGDVRDPTWPLIIPGVNPNLYTVTIEHEDGGYTTGGIVTEEIWQASMELQKLLVSGDTTALSIIRGGPQMAAQMAAIPKNELGFIDHHQIAGPNKPYCFRRWMNDPGFVEGSPSRRDRLLALLNAPEETDMRVWRPRTQRWTTKPNAPFFVGMDQKFFGPEPVEVESFAESGFWGADGSWNTPTTGFRLVRWPPLRADNEILEVPRSSLVSLAPGVPGLPKETDPTSAATIAALQDRITRKNLKADELKEI